MCLCVRGWKRGLQVQMGTNWQIQDLTVCVCVPYVCGLGSMINACAATERLSHFSTLPLCHFHVFLPAHLFFFENSHCVSLYHTAPPLDHFVAGKASPPPASLGPHPSSDSSAGHLAATGTGVRVRRPQGRRPAAATAVAAAGTGPRLHSRWSGGRVRGQRGASGAGKCGAGAGVCMRRRAPATPLPLPLPLPATRPHRQPSSLTGGLFMLLLFLMRLRHRQCPQHTPMAWGTGVQGPPPHTSTAALPFVQQLRSTRVQRHTARGGQVRLNAQT